ncbi:MAG: Gfo/Idh/MocA family oxidoreductase, partial [bacterium]
MYISIFSDELGMDVAEGIPIIKSWGLDHIDFRGQVFGKNIAALDGDQLRQLRSMLDANGLKTGCIQSFLAKVHLPDAARQRIEQDKLEGLIRAADALDCRLIRAFHYWQPEKSEEGQLAIRPDMLQHALDMFAPLARRAKEAGLTLAFENCGVTTDEVLAFLNALAIPAWGMAWDVANTWDCDERKRDEDAYIRKMVKHARLLHIKAHGAIEGIAPFMIPYHKILNACHNVGMDGPVSIETHNPDQTVSNVDRSKQVLDTLHKAWPTAAPGSSNYEEPSYLGVKRDWQDNPVGFVVVGMGMGHENSRKVVATPGCRLIGVCDLIESRAKNAGDTYKVPFNTDHREWLKRDDVEAVYVVTETGNHAAVAVDALRAGKHVLVTKPMEANVAACDRMISAAEENHVLLAVDFGRRFTSEMLTLRKAVTDGLFGRLLSGECSLRILRTMKYFKENGGWRGTRKLDGGGVFSNQAIHHIDDLVFALGLPAKVRADAWTQTHEIEAEDLGIATWLYASGLAIVVHATSSYPHSTWYTRLELAGDKGAYAFADDGPVGPTWTRWYLDKSWQEKAPCTVEPPWLNAAD